MASLSKTAVFSEELMMAGPQSLKRMSIPVGLFALCLSGVLAQGGKMKPEELVARHLKSIGPAEARASRETNEAEGRVRVKFLVSGSGSLQGHALFFCKGEKTRLSLQFDNLSYAGEDIVFDGKDFAIGRTFSGQRRSPFGEFLYTYNSLIKEGLMGSVLSTSWPLLDLKRRRPRLRYRGLEKIDETELHELSYRMRKGGGDFSISLYFDPQSFQHVKSIYKIRLKAPMSTRPTDVRQRETHYQLEESFSDFRTVDGLNVPSRWKLRFSISGTGSLLWEWDMHYEKITPNVPVG